MRTCKVCGTSIEYRRKDAVVCSNKCYQRSPKLKAYQRAYRQTPKYKASASRRAYKQTPKYKAYQRAYRQTPEHKARQKMLDAARAAQKRASKEHLAQAGSLANAAERQKEYV